MNHFALVLYNLKLIFVGWLSEVIYDSSVNFLPLLKLYQSILNRLGPLNTESFLEVQERLYRYLQKYCTEPVLCTAWRDTDFPLISPTVHIETLWFLINQSSALLGDLEKEMKQSIGKLGIEYNGLIKEKGNLKKEEVSIRAKFSDVAHNADQQVQNEMADILKRLMNSIEEVNAKIQEQKNQIKRLNQILARIYKRDNPSFLGIDRHERGYWWLSSVLSATSENGELETIKNGRRCVGLLIESSYLNQKNHKSEFFFVKDYASLYSIRQAMCPFGKNEYALSKTLDLSLSVYLNHCKTLEPTKSNNVVDFLKEGTNSFTNWVQKMSAPKITERNALKYHEKFKEELVQVSNELFLSYGLEDLSKVTPFELSENVSIGHYRWMFQELVNMGLLPFFNVTKRNALKACKTFSSYFCWSSRQMKYFKAASLKLAQEQEKEENEKQLKLMKQKEKEKRITTAATPIKIVIDRPVIKPKPVRKSTVPDFIDPSIYEVEDESESKDSNDIENDVKSEGGDEIDDNYSNGSMHESRKRARRRSKRKRNAVDSISDSISSRTTTDSLIDTSTSRASRKRARRRAKRKAKAAESISDSISSKTTTDSLIESSTSEVSRKRSRRKPRKGKLPVDSSSIDSSINQSDRGKSDSSDDKLPEASESDDPLLSRKRQRNSKKRKRQKKNKRKLESENIKSVSASQSGFVLANTNTDELLYMISSDED
ncbi:hypothetical protein BC833DRAFT_423654 [Globomyces pollinis-pini]|nr:hypothetical protein BC833DRAFT_423654 [Globomyces pollinis-pini]